MGLRRWMFVIQSAIKSRALSWMWYPSPAPKSAQSPSSPLSKSFKRTASFITSPRNMVPLCFLANLLGPRAATETHKVALLFTTSPTYCWIRVGYLRSPCLGLHNVGQGTPRISLQRLTDRVEPLLSFFTWDEMFGFELLEDDWTFAVDTLVWLFVFQSAGLHAFVHMF